jgi:uncharacterized membrane protein AbrB (regulator of aidB expression)
MALPDDTAVFKATLDLCVLLGTVLLMVTVGMNLKGRHLREVTRHKRAIGLLLVAQIAGRAATAGLVAEVPP